MEGAAASDEADLAAARAIPDLTFRLGYTRDTFAVSGDLANSLALSVAAPLPFFDHGQYGQAEALSGAGGVCLACARLACTPPTTSAGRRNRNTIAASRLRHVECSVRSL
jgi:hypothetical protein